MTYTIPDIFIEQKDPGLVEIEAGLYLERMRSTTQPLTLRNTLHGVLFIESGSKTVAVGHRKQVVEKDHAIFFAKGRIFTNRNSDSFRATTLFFDDRFVMDFLGRHNLDLPKRNRKSLILDYSSYGAIASLLDSIRYNYSEKREEFRKILRQKIDLLLLEFYYSYPALGAWFRQLRSDAEDPLSQIIQTHLDSIQSISHFRRLTGMSPTTFHRTFRQRYGSTPKQWLEVRRMERAESLLLYSDLSISQVAAECGYATVSWFIERFKKHHRCTPGSFRRKNRDF